MTNSLGSFAFIRADQNSMAPETLKTRAAVVQRPGVPGAGVIDMAKAGREFVLQTVVDVTSRDLAETKLKDYRNAILADKYVLIWSDINYQTKHSCLYIILDVVNPRIEPVVESSGGLNDGNFLVWADFVLIAVFEDPPEEEP